MQPPGFISGGGSTLAAPVDLQEHSHGKGLEHIKNSLGLNPSSATF